MRRQCDIMSDELTPGEKASKTKGKDVEIEAGRMADRTKKRPVYTKMIK